MKSIQGKEVGRLLRGRMGLIVGPAITQFPGALSDLGKRLAKRLNVKADDSYLAVGDRAIAAGNTEREVRDAVRDILSSCTASAVIGHLSCARWSAILSATLENCLEDRLQREADRRPIRKPIVVLTDFSVPPPPRTVPCFKLLGMHTRTDFAVSTVSYVRRRATWRYALPVFGERVKGSPVLCVGMADSAQVLLDLLAELMACPSSAPSGLVLLRDDPLSRDSQLESLVGGRTQLYVADGALADVVGAVTAAESTGYTFPLPSTESTSDDFELLRRHSELVAIVNDQTTSQVAAEQTNRLHDILFAPSVTRWDPFVHDLDFHRTLGGDLRQQLHGQLTKKKLFDFACAVIGGAASGKTTLLKRLALDLAKLGHLVLWLKPWFYPDAGRAVRALFADIGRLKSPHRDRVAIFLDDAVNSGPMSPANLASAAQACNVTVALVIGARTSDWKSIDHSTFLGPLTLEFEEEVPDDLDGEEWKAFPDYLVRLGIAENRDKAITECQVVPNQAVKDTLSTLYWLLPATRASIASSIRDEYFRLGDMAGLRSLVVGAAEHTTSLLKSAYEMVAVADHYRVPLPVEVLVAALEVDYGPWLDASGASGPAWGILYADEDEDGATVYRTRNAIVTRMIVETINGGTLGHSGELRVLTRLIEGCRGHSSSVYREFCVRALVRNSPFERLDFDEGLSLYEKALDALPFPDKTLMHHKGLWMKNKGQNPLVAAKTLEQALETPVYPYAEKGEADEHIHTSLAATELDAIDAGHRDLSEGKAVVLQHLAHARSKDFFNPRAVHVQGNLILRLARKIGEGESPDLCALVNKAVADVDRTLLVLANPARTSPTAHQDMRYLEDIRGKLFASLGHIADLDAEANRIWDTYQSQDGFILVARRLYQEARTANKGKLFQRASSYCKEVRRTVEAAGTAISPALAEVELLNYYQWRVVRAIFSKLEAEIDWPTLKNLAEETFRLPADDASPLHRYVYAVSLAHLGNWTDAYSQFHQLRQSSLRREILWTPRGYYLDVKGSAKHVQGLIKGGARKHFLYVEDLHADFHLDRHGDWPQEGEIALAYIQFSFAGPTAVQDL